MGETPAREGFDRLFKRFLDGEDVPFDDLDLALSEALLADLGRRVEFSAGLRSLENGLLGPAAFLCGLRFLPAGRLDYLEMDVPFAWSDSEGGGGGDSRGDGPALVSLFDAEGLPALCAAGAFSVSCVSVPGLLSCLAPELLERSGLRKVYVRPPNVLVVEGEGRLGGWTLGGYKVELLLRARPPLGIEIGLGAGSSVLLNLPAFVRRMIMRRVVREIRSMLARRGLDRFVRVEEPQDATRFGISWKGKAVPLALDRVCCMGGAVRLFFAYASSPTVPGHADGEAEPACGCDESWLAMARRLDRFLAAAVLEECLRDTVTRDAPSLAESIAAACRACGFSLFSDGRWLSVRVAEGSGLCCWSREPECCSGGPEALELIVPARQAEGLDDSALEEFCMLFCAAVERDLRVLPFLGPDGWRSLLGSSARFILYMKHRRGVEEAWSRLFRCLPFLPPVCAAAILERSGSGARRAAGAVWRRWKT